MELVEILPELERPRTILYLASGDHLAPLGLCELLPEGAPCRLIMTEIDAGVQEGIDVALADLEGAGVCDGVLSDTGIEGRSGRRIWRGTMGSRPFSVELRVSDPNVGAPLVIGEMVAEVDLVISHDWSGEPLGNFQVIFRFLEATRQNPGVATPLMIEDLGAHPYEIDLGPFVPAATSEATFGHRDSDAGPGRHGQVELGTPIFGGAVMLTFGDPWWRVLSDQQLESVFDFLLLNQFESDRQNVLEGGSDPLLAPMLLDWWTGYGARGIRGDAITLGPGGTRERMIEAAIATRSGAGPTVAAIFGARLDLYRDLLALRARGHDTLDLMPSARYTRRPAPNDFPTPDMERLYRQALRQVGLMRTEREDFAAEAAELLKILPSRSPERGGDETTLRRDYLDGLEGISRLERSESPVREGPGIIEESELPPGN